jgi:hypothetical protein
VNPATLEDSHSVTSERASRAELRPACDDRLAEAQVESFRLTLALRAETPYNAGRGPQSVSRPCAS